MSPSTRNTHRTLPQRSGGPLRAFGRAVAGLGTSTVLIFFAIKLHPWPYAMEVGIGPMAVDDHTWSLVETMQAARYADGLLHSEFLEFVVDVLTHYRIGLAIFLMGAMALVLTIRRR